MTLSITFKQQCEEFSSQCDQFGSGSYSNNDEYIMWFQTILKRFNVEYNLPETILMEYPDAKLGEISIDNDDDEAPVIITLTTDGYFSCKLNRKYKLYLGKRVPVQSIIDKEKCHFSEIDIELATILSDAVYYSDPILHINKNYSSYSCISTLTDHRCGLKFAPNASSPYLLAISKSNVAEETLWVAFRGTTNINDVLTDLTIHPALTSSGMVHRGFSKRASDFPYETLLHEFNSTSDNNKRLIFTGHSLGGSAAHLCAMFNLANKSFKQNPKIYSIAFGAPFIGNSTVAKDLIKNNFNDHFLTIINQSDIVPNILNLVETGARIQSTMAAVIESCSEIANTLLPLISLVTEVPAKVINTSICTLNLVLPKLKKVLDNKITEYKPIGQYGFIRSLMPLDNQDQYEWIISYKSNTIKTDRDTKEEKFIDIISKKLIESFGPSTATITDTNIIYHYMEKYMSSLISCGIIRFQSSTFERNHQQRIAEFQRFNPHIQKATAICSDKDIKITIIGDHLDFSSFHQKMCISTSENFFQPNSVLTASEISRDKVVLMSNSLVPAEKRVTIGPRKYILNTHFGEMNLNLQLYDDDNNEHQATPTYHMFDTNFLMASFLRSFFECIHSNNDLFLTNTNSNLRHIAKLVENRLPEKFQSFKSLLEKHFNICQQMKKNNKPISIDDKLYNDMSGLIIDLYKALAQFPEYTYTKSFLQRARENPAKFLLCGVGALAGTYVLLHVGLFGLVGYQLFAGTSFSATLAQLGVTELLATAQGTVGFYEYLGNIGHGLLSRLIYHEHLAFLLNSMGSNSDNCANEKMLEIQICDILDQKSVDFNDISIKDKKTIEKIIKEKKLFDTNETTNSERPTLCGTIMDSQIKAFQFLHDVYYICKLRRSMTAQYISFIGAHRAGKSSLLKSLWNIPAQRGDHLDNRTQAIQIFTLYDENSSNKVHLIDYPGVTDPVQTVAHLNQNYSVFSTFYVIVVRAGTDYSSAAELIKELQTSSAPLTTTETNQQTLNATTSTTSKLGNERDSNREQKQYGLNKSAKFVVVITGIDTIPDSLIENELDEAVNRRLNIDKELICLCYNNEAISDEKYLRLHESRNLPGIAELRTFLNKHFNQLLDKHSDFHSYKYREQ